MPKPSQRKLLLEVPLPVPLEEAWKALKDPNLIREWFGYYGADYSSWGGALETLDDEIKAVFTDEAVYNDIGHRITWEGGDEFLLSPRRDSTCVLEVFVVRPALQSEMDWKKAYDSICEGWVSFVQQLRFFLERHRSDERSTLFMTGIPAPVVYDKLQLARLAEVEPGSKYGVLTRMGDHLTGDLWFKTLYQIGLTVDTFGDGLLIVAATPPTEDLPDGGADLIITTFLDDASFDELQMRWIEAFSAPVTSDAR